MTAAQQVDATIARAEHALTTRTVADLALAEASLIGSLDWAARQETPSTEQLVRDVLRTVSTELAAARAYP